MVPPGLTRLKVMLPTSAKLAKAPSVAAICAADSTENGAELPLASCAGPLARTPQLNATAVPGVAAQVIPSR